MTRSNTITALLLITLTCPMAHAQELDSTGVPGDNFSLSAALETFKKAKSPEEFEQMINKQDNNVNNLDLNGDGEIDYIKVIDKRDGDAHAFVLQDVVSQNENQDIAVIELEKQKDGDAVLQIIGDEDIYGEAIIVEPVVEQQSSKSTQPVIVNVWAWPAVRYVYAPAYTVWVSPWGWRARPLWWHPWRPIHVKAFYPYRAPYRSHYVVVHHHRVVHAHNIYRPTRTTSVTVQTKNAASVNHYRATRVTRTTATVSHGHQSRTVQKTTTARGKRKASRDARRVAKH